MERIVERGLLYDFYGELLTEHQRNIYADLVLGDMSLSELAEEYEISRQAAHDLIRRCDKILEEYESKLKLIESYKKRNSLSEEMADYIEKAEKICPEGECRELILRIKQLNNEIRNE